jgi:hypothetical protein
MHSSISNTKTRALGRRFARLLPVLLIALFALSLSGCSKDIQTLEVKEGGRAYIDGLFYQVQLSRSLNPKDVEDSFYLTGQPTPAKGDSYFGVFMRVDNETNANRILPIGIQNMQIKNASGQVFKPIIVRGQGWAYAPAPIGKAAHLPIPDTPADVGPIRGGLILFKIPYASLDSRPLILYIKSAGGKVGQITLDV